MSYNRFTEIVSSAVLPLTVCLSARLVKKTGLYYVDSTPLKVSRNLRIGNHHVDKAYLSEQKAGLLKSKGLRLLTKVRRNMKQKTMTFLERFFLAWRFLIETRHRSAKSFVSN